MCERVVCVCERVGVCAPAVIVLLLRSVVLLFRWVGGGRVSVSVSIVMLLCSRY